MDASYMVITEFKLRPLVSGLKDTNLTTKFGDCLPYCLFFLQLFCAPKAHNWLLGSLRSRPLGGALSAV